MVMYFGTSIQNFCPPTEISLSDRIILYWSKFRVSEIKYIEKFGGRVLADFKVVFKISKDICIT